MKEKLEKAIKENGYSPVSALEKDTFGRYHGLVKNKSGNNFFVKAVVGKGNYRYNSLLSEIHITQHIVEKTQNRAVIKNGYQLFIPRIEKVINQNDVLCVISDYIDAQKLLEQPSAKQAKILIATLDLVEELNKYVQLEKISNYLKNYTKIRLLIDIVLKLTKAVYLTPHLSGKLIITAFRTLPIVYSNSKKSLVHADINASNILFDENKIFLTDWEEAGWGMPEYNIIAPLSVHWVDKIIREPLLFKLHAQRSSIVPLLAYRTIVLFNQKISSTDSRRKRDLDLLNFISNKRMLI